MAHPHHAGRQPHHLRATATAAPAPAPTTAPTTTTARNKP
jgi:hypothetical protein